MEIEFEWNPFSTASKAARAERNGRIGHALPLYAKAGQIDAILLFVVRALSKLARARRRSTPRRRVPRRGPQIMAMPSELASPEMPAMYPRQGTGIPCGR